MSMNYSIKTWLNFFNLTTMGLCHMKNTRRHFISLHWTLNKYLSSIWDQLLTNKKAIETVTDEAWEFAIKATIIPFSIITSMFHQCFKKYRFLESILELLQQFYLQTESIAQDIRLCPGDLSKFCLKCLQWGERITPFETLGKVLFIAPMANSHHLYKYCHQNLLSMIHSIF